eukprot:TRINITY_DN41706_c0_g3_i1.p1 TRINITY_DN41706_c0_g3~~TRINITY_DN41706_c0_g3_i1.p1  ORF type:complete len:947 (+),score=241.84 TRINITY_DN41706_c0_g3_i1:107-2947(+)
MLQAPRPLEDDAAFRKHLWPTAASRVVDCDAASTEAPGGASCAGTSRPSSRFESPSTADLYSSLGGPAAMFGFAPALRAGPSSSSNKNVLMLGHDAILLDILDSPRHTTAGGVAPMNGARQTSKHRQDEATWKALEAADDDQLLNMLGAIAKGGADGGGGGGSAVASSLPVLGMAQDVMELLPPEMQDRDPVVEESAERLLSFCTAAQEDIHLNAEVTRKLQAEIALLQQRRDQQSDQSDLLLGRIDAAKARFADELEAASVVLDDLRLHLQEERTANERIRATYAHGIRETSARASAFGHQIAEVGRIQARLADEFRQATEMQAELQQQLQERRTATRQMQLESLTLGVSGSDASLPAAPSQQRRTSPRDGAVGDAGKEPQQPMQPTGPMTAKLQALKAECAGLHQAQADREQEREALQERLGKAGRLESELRKKVTLERMVGEQEVDGLKHLRQLEGLSVLMTRWPEDRNPQALAARGLKLPSNWQDSDIGSWALQSLACWRELSVKDQQLSELRQLTSERRQKWDAEQGLFSEVLQNWDADAAEAAEETHEQRCRRSQCTAQRDALAADVEEAFQSLAEEQRIADAVKENLIGELVQQREWLRKKKLEVDMYSARLEATGGCCRRRRLPPTRAGSQSHHAMAPQKGAPLSPPPLSKQQAPPFNAQHPNAHRQGGAALSPPTKPPPSHTMQQNARHQEDAVKIASPQPAAANGAASDSDEQPEEEDETDESGDEEPEPADDIHASQQRHEDCPNTAQRGPCSVPPPSGGQADHRHATLPPGEFAGTVSPAAASSTPAGAATPLLLPALLDPDADAEKGELPAGAAHLGGAANAGRHPKRPAAASSPDAALPSPLKDTPSTWNSMPAPASWENMPTTPCEEPEGQPFATVIVKVDSPPADAAEPLPESSCSLHGQPPESSSPVPASPPPPPKSPQTYRTLVVDEV